MITIKDYQLKPIPAEQWEYIKKKMEVLESVPKVKGFISVKSESKTFSIGITRHPAATELTMLYNAYFSKKKTESKRCTPCILKVLYFFQNIIHNNIEPEIEYKGFVGIIPAIRAAAGEFKHEENKNLTIEDMFKDAYKQPD